MIYVFDTNSFIKCNAYYPKIFPAFWAKLDQAVASGHVISTREVRTEIEQGDDDTIAAWAKDNKALFTTPDAAVTAFVGKIFAVPHFQQLIGAKAQLRGTPVADPFVIACAHAKRGTVVTEERLKPNAAKIPNVCDRFGIACTNLEGFMQALGWTF